MRKIMPSQPRSPLNEWTRILLDNVDTGPHNLASLKVAPEHVAELKADYEKNKPLFRAMSIAGGTAARFGDTLV